MNLLEFVCSLALAVLVILCSRGLGHILGLPAAVAVIPTSGILLLLLRVFTKISSRGLLLLSSVLVLVPLLSMGLAPILGLRDSIFAIPLAFGIVLIAIQLQGKLLASRRAKDVNASRHESE